jgi:hypothetical protein
MQIPQPDISLRSERSRNSTNPEFQKRFESGLNELKTDVSERPFFWLGVAYITGFLCNTFPIRLLFIALVRLASWLSGPVILLMGIIKISDLFSSPRR